MISGNWTRMPVLLLVDVALPEEHRELLGEELSDPEVNITPLESVTLAMPAALEAMRLDGYARRIQTEFPYELSDTTAQLALYSIFRKMRAGLRLSDYPARPYGLINHRVDSPADYLRIAEEYMSNQDPLTLARLYSIERPPPAAYMPCCMANPEALLAFAKTIATGVVVATVDPDKAPNLPFVMVPEFTDEAEEYVSAVMDTAEILFRQLKVKNT